ncbi:MAG: NAD(P)H-dependent oxidoreductase subunit E [Candidatus Eisenbacteria sp.]|nr:NAD(P)H-dependent oxidoreductase subunit E [Candidatus Eisenbacteria bacterium]
MNAENRPENAITINGHRLPFEPGETILDVAKRNNIFIPTLCHLPGAPPTGACRICTVDVEGPKALAAACTTPCAPKMVVRTNSPKVLAARRAVLGLLLASGHHNCSARRTSDGTWTSLQRDTADYDQSEELCEVYGTCRLQALSYRYQVDSGRYAARAPEYPLEMASPLIIRDFSRCILCGRCVQACNEIQVNNAISHGFRGAKVKIIAIGNQELDRSDCVFCGECIQSCPVGALVEKRSRYQVRPWEVRHHRATCHYCSVGCQLDLQLKDGRVMKVEGVEGADPNLGRLCIQGRFGFDFLQAPDRITRPLVRENGALREATWDEALERVASRIREVKESDGPDAIAAVCSAKASNETLFLAQKLLRAVIGTHNVSAPLRALPMTNSLGELERAGRILLIGSDVTAENPVAGSLIKRAQARGCELIVVDDAETRIQRFAKLVVQPRKGTEAVLFQGLIRRLLETGKARGFDEERKTAEEYPLEKVSAATGVGEGEIEQLVSRLRAGGPTMLVYGAKVAAWAPLFYTIQRALENLGVACGGVNPLAALNNSVGAALMGAEPTLLPGYQPVGDPQARQRWEQAWNCRLGETPGRGTMQIVGSAAGAAGAAGEGGKPRIRLLYSLGEDLTLLTAGLPGAQEALAGIEFLVVQASRANQMTAQADVVLPAAAWVEEEGTTINCERRVTRITPAVEAPGEARPGIWILTALARRLGADWPERSPGEIWETEIAPLVTQVAGITYARLAGDGRQWPVPDPQSVASVRLDGDALPTLPPEGELIAYHHRNLLEQCHGLLESLPDTEGGTRDWPSDREEVTQAFEAFLEEEESTEKKIEIDEVLVAHRQRRGGLIPVLQKSQEILGFLPVPAQNYIAVGLGVPAADVFGVVSFYSFFTMVPRGRYTVRLCLGTACYVKGAQRLLETLERHLRITVGETTPDREFSLEAVRCLGACGLAPVMMVGEKTHGMLDPKEVTSIVESYRSKENDT